MATRPSPFSSFNSDLTSYSSFDSLQTTDSALDGDRSFLGSYFQPTEPGTSQATKGSSNGETVCSARSMTTRTSSFTPDHNTMAVRPASNTAAQPAGQKLRSQYPNESSEKHVDYVLVATFHKTKGSIMEHQYPAPISPDDNMFAELMLPEQAHSRTDDWTVFYLHKEAADEDVDEEASQRRTQRNSTQDAALNKDDQDALSESAVEGPGLIYVLNRVQTKHDSSAVRGADCKAMAICTRHPFLHIFKPLLVLALDDYFKEPSLNVLANLYDSINSLDLSLMPRLNLLERSILQASTSKDMFIEKFEQIARQRVIEDTSQSNPQLDEATTPRIQGLPPRDTHEFESRIMYNGMPIPVKIPTARLQETVGDPSIKDLIETFSKPHATSPQPFVLHPHLTTNGINTHPIIVLVNALLTQKRIIFLGHNLPSDSIANAVLASCALVSGGILRGFTRHAFPYTDLTKIESLLEVPGFVAGVTNPVFESNPAWWDLLCDLSTGRMRISSMISPPQPSDGVQSFLELHPSLANSAQQQALQSQDATGDAAFMDSVLRSIVNRVDKGVIRSMWRDWTVKFVRIAALYEEMIYGASGLHVEARQADEGAYGIKGHGYVWADDNAKAREMAANIQRIEGWRGTRSFYTLVYDISVLYKCKPITTIDLDHHHDRLRTKKLPKDDAADIYLAFEKAVRTPDEISQLLTVTSESHGGLFYISLGLFHPRKDVRKATYRLLDRMRHHEAGRHFWKALSRFTKTAFSRMEIEQHQKDHLRDDSDTLSKATTLMEQTSIA